MTARLLTRDEARAYCGGVDHSEDGDRFDLEARLARAEAFRMARRKPAAIIKSNALEASPRLLHKRMKVAVRKSLNDNATRTAWTELCGYTLDELRAHLEARFTDGMSWENMALWHIDHVRPLASFNITGIDCPEFKKAWALDNLQPLWALDNLRKGARW